MNLAVDYNELLFLALLICLAADICYFVKEYDRSFYFYNQSVAICLCRGLLVAMLTWIN